MDIKVLFHKLFHINCSVPYKLFHIPFIIHTGNAIQRKIPTYMFVCECPYLYIAG